MGVIKYTCFDGHTKVYVLLSPNPGQNNSKGKCI